MSITISYFGTFPAFVLYGIKMPQRSVLILKIFKKSAREMTKLTADNWATTHLAKTAFVSLTDHIMLATKCLFIDDIQKAYLPDRSYA